MKPGNGKRITIFSAQQGHASISEAVLSHLKKAGYQATVHDVGDNALSLYKLFYLYFPGLFKVPFKLAELNRARGALDSFSASLYRAKVAQALKDDQPDLVISTWAFANSSIERALASSKIPFINVMTDPRTFHSIMPSQAAINLTFDQVASARTSSLGIPKDKIVESGWFVRNAYRPVRKDKVFLTSHDIAFDKPVLLLTSGSEGTNYILKLTPTLIQANLPVTIIVACGNNKRLFTLIEGMKKLNDLVHTPSKTTLIPIRFTKELHKYMQVADLVVGKAGPNVLFESVATHTPFFAITHISGQEDGNLDIIRDYQLGYVEENIMKAHKLITDLITHPEKLKQSNPRLKEMALHNKRSKQVLLDVISTVIR